MTDRTTKVTLVAQVSGYLAGMDAAAKRTALLGTEAAKLAQKKESINQLGTAFLAVGAVAAVAVGLAVKAFAEFDAKMSQVKTLSHATTAEMAELTNAALHAGQAIGFSANDVADAEIELVKAGISVGNIMGGALTGALQLAAAGQIDVADATEIATIAMTQFALKGKDIPHVADLLAAGADKALGGVSDLGEALKSGGLVSAQFGISLDDTVGVLSAFANAGLIGETAGTDLRQMLLKLANPSADAAKTLKNLGISIYDSSGQFVGLTKLSGELNTQMKDLDPSTRNAALATVFGSRAIAGANVLYNEGAKGIASWIGKVDDSGFAAQQAAGKMDNLKGDASKLGAAFQTDLIESASGANDVLRSIVQSATYLVSAFGDLPAPVLNVGVAIGTVVAAIGLVGGGVLKAVPKIQGLKGAFDLMGVSAKAGALAVGLVGGAVALATIAIGSIVGAQAEAKAAADAFADSLDKTTGALTSYSRALVAKALQDANAFDAAKQAGVSQSELTTAVLDGGAALDAVQEKLTAYAFASKQFGGRTGSGPYQQLGDTIDKTRKSVVDGTEAFKNQNAAVQTDGDSLESAATQYKNAADKAKDLSQAVSDLTDQINTANGVGQDAVSSNAAYQKALADLSTYVDNAKKKVDGYSFGVNENTAAGSANVAMLADLAAKNEDAAKKQLALDSNTSKYQSTLAAGHAAVVENAKALGATAAQAQNIADKVAAIPTKKEVQVLVDTNNASKVLGGFINAWNGAKIRVNFDGSYTLPSGRIARAAGGILPGSPSKRDNMVINAASGEFITNSAATAKPANRAALEYMNAGGTIPGFASGGYLSRSGAPHYARGDGGTHIDNRQIVITVPISGAVIGDENHIGKVVTTSVRTALRNGAIPADWMNR